MQIKQVQSYYNPTQIRQYLQYVRKFAGRNESVVDLSVDVVQAASTFRCTLENLALLIRLHLVAFPFEDTAMH